LNFAFEDLLYGGKPSPSSDAAFAMFFIDAPEIGCT
jgi:hypothetical protein